VLHYAQLNVPLWIDAKITFTTLVRKSGGAPDVRYKSLNQRDMSTSPEAEALAAALPVDSSFRMELFPMSDLWKGSELKLEEHLTIATPVCQDWDELICFPGFTVRITNEEWMSEKALFVRFPATAGWHATDFTEAVLALIELAEEGLNCDHIYLCLENNPQEIRNLVHSLMYVGFGAEDSPIEGASSNLLMLKYETE